ncbi:MAG TPA: hypothetical protein VHT73_02810 [Thermodesulfobacteriota bacterium]|nr:hypothetical protein [Thermodesulfobacteriota bacterium]
MKRYVVFKAISVLTIVSLLITQFSQRALTQEQVQPYLDLKPSDRALEIVEVKLTNETVNPDGSISADVELVAKSALTYGLALSVENGQLPAQR